LTKLLTVTKELLARSGTNPLKIRLVVCDYPSEVALHPAASELWMQCHRWDSAQIINPDDAAVEDPLLGPSRKPHNTLDFSCLKRALITIGSTGLEKVILGTQNLHTVRMIWENDWIFPVAMRGCQFPHVKNLEVKAREWIDVLKMFPGVQSLIVYLPVRSLLLDELEQIRHVLPDSCQELVWANIADPNEFPRQLLGLSCLRAPSIVRLYIRGQREEDTSLFRADSDFFETLDRFVQKSRCKLARVEIQSIITPTDFCESVTTLLYTPNNKVPRIEFIQKMISDEDSIGVVVSTDSACSIEKVVDWDF
jgi:hypothetical protein